MKVAALFLHGMAPGRAFCVTGIDRGSKEYAECLGFLGNHAGVNAPGGVPPGFNTWHMWKCSCGCGYGLKRFTWDMAWYGSFEELGAKLENYREGLCVTS